MKYFYGPDTYGAREAVQASADEKDAPIRWVDREHLEKHSLEAVLDEAGAGLFGEQLVVIRDASNFPKALQEQIIQAAKSAKQSDWVVWDRENPDKRSVLFKALKPYATAFPLLSFDEAATWIQKTYDSVERAAAVEIARRCGADRLRITHEIEKLELTHQPITRADIEQEVPSADAADEVFPFLDALASGSARRAMQLLEQLLAAGNSEFYVLSMLGYQYKTLLAIAAGRADGLHPYVIQKNKSMAKRYSVSVLQNIFARLAATDFVIKQGKIDQRTALIMLVLNLAGA